MKGKHFLIGIAVLAVVAVIFISVDDSFPPEFATGTIGVADTVVSGVEAASRYRTEQINADDVQLGDTEVQKLLQNDAFIALVQDPKFAKAIEAFNELEKALDEEINNKAIQGPDGGSNEIPEGKTYLDALEDQKIMAAIQDEGTRDALFDDDVKRLIVSSLWESMIKDQSVRDYIAGVAVKGGERDETNEFKSGEGDERPQDNEFKAGEGDEREETNEFKAGEGDEREETNEFKALEGGDTPQDNEFKALEGGDTPQDNEFKALEGGDTPQDNEFKALEGGDTPQDNTFESLEGGDTPQDNTFESLEGGDTPQDNTFESLEGGETPQENNFEAVADDVREVLESQNFKKSVQDHPGFWKQVSEDPGFAKAIQENYEALEAFGRIPEGDFGRAVEAISEGLEVIRGGESVLGDLAKYPEPVFNLVAQDPAFEAILEDVFESNENER